MGRSNFSTVGGAASVDSAVPPLFVNDDELRNRINPSIGRARFRSAIQAIEANHSDFPRFNPLFKGRYWPAVQAWLDRHNGLRENGATDGEDGEETWG
jgi:hypothetical protein